MLSLHAHARHLGRSMMRRGRLWLSTNLTGELDALFGEQMPEKDLRAMRVRKQYSNTSEFKLKTIEKALISAFSII